MSRRLFFLASKHIVRFLLLAVAIIGLMVCADSSSAGEINAGSSVTQFSAGPVGQRCEKKFDSKKRAFSVAEVARLWIADEQILQSLARSATENTSQSLPVGALESVYPATPCLTASVGVSALIADAATMLYVAARTGGAYFSWWKLLLIVLTFLVWVRNADWVNQDAVKIEKEAELNAGIWNLLSVLALLGGFFAAISVPIFWIGYPLMLLATLMPFIWYRIVRRGKLKDSQSLRRKVNRKSYDNESSEELAQDQGVEMSINAAGASDGDRKAALIRARQSPGYVDFKELLHQGMLKRADYIQIDYTQTQAAPRLFVDGTWHALPNMDRIKGDALLVSLKNVAGLDAEERRKKQSGDFSLKSEMGKANLHVVSKGVKTGERVRVTFVQSKEIQKLPNLGMFPSMAKKFVAGLNSPGICIVSAPPKHGLTSTWQGLLVTADRLTRDCVVVMDDDETESSIENVAVKEFDSDETAAAFLKKTFVAQPDAVAVPRVPSPEFMDLLTLEAKTQQRSVWMRAKASSAAEALLRTYSLAGDRGDFRETIKFVTCQRLVRRLCDSCKEDIAVPPKMIKKLGGDPSKIKTLSRQWQLPPPEQRVDENGNPIEFPPCNVCGGIGYIGRIAVFEMIKVNDGVREALKKTPKVGAIDAAAKESKAKKSMKSSAYQLVLMGVTSLQEVQNVLNKK